MTRPRILIAGIGNIFFGDDAFGVEVAQQLFSRCLPEDVRVVDFGIRGIDLTYALLDGYESVVLVDATSCGGPPGTLYVIEPDRDFEQAAPFPGPALDMHRLDPARVLQVAASMQASVQNVFLVGCEPSPIESDEMLMGLSNPVKGAVVEAVQLVEDLVEKLLSGKPPRNGVGTRELHFTQKAICERGDSR